MMQEQMGRLVLAPADQNVIGPGLRNATLDQGPQARDLGRMLRRRLGLIILLVAALNGFAFWAVSQLKPRYSAEAAVLVGLRQQQVVDLKAVLAGLSGESDVIESEIQVIKSRDVARSIVRAYDLDKLPEFNPELAPPGIVTRLREFVAGLFGGSRDTALEMLPAPAPAPHAVRDPLGPVVDEFVRHLWVAPRGRSRVLSIGFESTDPALAATIANAVANAYIANQLREKTQATADAHRWLNERVAELREQVLNADAAVVAYQRKSGLTEGRQGSLVNEQIAQLSEQMIRAEAEEAEAQARLREATRQALPIAGLQLVVGAAHDRTEMLRNELSDLRQQLNNGNESEVELHALQHEADADRVLYDRLLARLKETNIEAGLQTPDAQVISRAESPEQPTFPKRSVILPVVFLSTLMIIGLLVMGLEALDQGISSLEQIERVLGVPAIGVLPNVRRRALGRRTVEQPTTGRPGAALGESLRGLYTSLRLASGETSPRVVLITSALPREGRTSMILAMARMLAQSGKRVLVIDTDLRRGKLHRICGVSRKPGLLECLSGTTPVAEALTRDPETAVCLLTAGDTNGVSPDILGSPEMGQLLRKFSTVFDVVLLDSAPLLEVADARNLCRWADCTIMLVRWRDTGRDAVAAGVRQIMEAGGNLAGCVLTLVDPRRYRHYGDRGLYAQRGGLYLLK